MHSAVAIPQTPVRGGQVWPLSVEAYHVLGQAGVIPENTELLYGTVYTKMPKSAYHSTLAGLFTDILGPILPSGFIVRVEQPITCHDSEPEPDVAVVKGARTDFRDKHPQSAELVIEICVTSHEYDRSKLRAYANSGVKECWLVLGPEKQIEVYRDPQSSEFRERDVFGPGGTIASAAVPGLAVSLENLFSK